MENDRYLTWTGVYLGSTLGLYLAINYRPYRKPVWYVLGALGYVFAYYQGPREKSPDYLRDLAELENYTETNYGAL